MTTSLAIARRMRPWLFFGLTYAWTWLFWIAAALLGRSADAPAVQALIGLGGVGPTAAALSLILATPDHEARKDYWRRLIEPRRIGPRWYVVLLLLPLFLTLLSALIDLALGGHGMRLEAAAGLVERPLEAVPFVLFYLLFGPLPEELGWRGYALPGLQARTNALHSSLTLGAAWALWHLPLFFIPGTFQAGLGLGTAPFWTFLLGMVPLSAVYTWIVNSNHGSTLSAVLFHFSVNVTGQLFALSPRSDLILFALWVAAALLIVATCGPERLSCHGVGLRRRGVGEAG